MAAFPLYASTATYQWSTSTNFGWITPIVQRAVTVTGPAITAAAWCRIHLAGLGRPCPPLASAVAVWDGPFVFAVAAPREHRLRIGTRRRART